MCQIEHQIECRIESQIERKTKNQSKCQKTCHMQHQNRIVSDSRMPNYILQFMSNRMSKNARQNENAIGMSIGGGHMKKTYSFPSDISDIFLIFPHIDVWGFCF